MNIFKHELKQNISSTVIWTVSLLAIAALYISIFPSITEEMSSMFESFPPAFRRVFGIGDAGFSSFLSLYAMIFNIIVLVGAVQAMNLGTGIVSKEIKDKTADFLMTKPVSRVKILFQKLFSGISLLMLTNIIYLLFAWFLVNVFVEESFELQTFLTVSSVLFLVQAFFYVLGIFMGVVLPKIKSVIAISLPAVFGFYVFGFLDDVIGEDKIKYLTPFKLFKLEELGLGNSHEAGSLLYLGLVSLALIIGAFYIFQKKDIHTV